MIAVIFEVQPKAEYLNEYLRIAAELKPRLMKIDGFISIERFSSLQNSDKILSLSFWKDEASVKQWRNLEEHRQAQKNGRDIIFEDYRLRVSSVIRDYGMFDRTQVPSDSRSI